jgi:hypothetical protein
MLLVDHGMMEKAILYLKIVNLDFSFMALSLTTILNFKRVIRNNLCIEINPVHLIFGFQ